jgi:hypothetical protein
MTANLAVTKPQSGVDEMMLMFARIIPPMMQQLFSKILNLDNIVEK